MRFKLICTFCFLLYFGVSLSVNSQSKEKSVPPDFATYSYAVEEQSVKGSDPISVINNFAQPDSSMIFGVTPLTILGKIKYDDQAEGELILSIERALLDSLTIFYINHTRDTVYNWFGLKVDSHSTEISHNYPAIRFEADAIQNRTIYFAAKSSYALLLPVVLKPIDRFFEYRQILDVFSAFLLGGLFGMLLYNLFLWISSSEKIYLIYSTGIFITIIIQSSIQGYLIEFLNFPSSVEYYYVSVGIALNLIFAIWFCVELLEKRNFPKWLLRILFLLVGLGGLIILAEILGFEHLAKIVVVLSTSIGSLTLLIVGIILSFRKVILARYFTIAWFIYLVGIIIYGFRTEGYIEDNFFTANFAHIGKFCEVILLSFTLGHKYNIIKKERADLQFKLTTKLESLVLMRTSELEKALLEKNLLLKEVHHRVKNNLQIISSILSMQSRTLSSSAKVAVLDGRSRIKSMSLIHQRLYNSENITEINIRDYFNELIGYLFNSFSDNKTIVNRNLNAQSLCVDVEIAIPLGLILNELITNSLKYAFIEQKEGNIWVGFDLTDNVYTLTVQDDGRGFDQSTVNKKKMGLTLVSTLANQLDGEVELDTSTGTTIRIMFGKNADL